MQAIGFECSLDIQKSYEEEGRWIVEGFATTSDFDFHEDVITRQAIENSAKDLLENSTVLHNHNANESIGRVEASEARENGLWLKIYVSKTAAEIWMKIKEGVLNKFSIKGKIIDAKKQWLSDLNKYARMIYKMQLHEVSLVAVPANPKAKAIGWYVEKAIEQYESKGGELEEINDTNQSSEKGGGRMEKQMEIIEEELLIASGEQVNEQPDVQKSEAKVESLPQTWEQYFEKEKLAKKSEKEVWISWTAFCKDKGYPYFKNEEHPGKLKDEKIEKAGAKMSSGRLKKLKVLLSELTQIVTEVDNPEDESKQAEDTKEDKLTKKLDDVESTMSQMMKDLGLDKDKQKDNQSRITLADTLQAISKRLEVIENMPAVKTSVDGQEALGDSKQKQTVWKGLI